MPRTEHNTIKLLRHFDIIIDIQRQIRLDPESARIFPFRRMITSGMSDCWPSSPTAWSWCNHRGTWCSASRPGACPPSRLEGRPPSSWCMPSNPSEPPCRGAESATSSLSTSTRRISYQSNTINVGKLFTYNKVNSIDNDKCYTSK